MNLLHLSQRTSPQRRCHPQKLYVFLFELALVLTRPVCPEREGLLQFQVYRQPLPAAHLLLEDLPDGEGTGGSSFRGAFNSGNEKFSIWWRRGVIHGLASCSWSGFSRKPFKYIYESRSLCSTSHHWTGYQVFTFQLPFMYLTAPLSVCFVILISLPSQELLQGEQQRAL